MIEVHLASIFVLALTAWALTGCATNTAPTGTTSPKPLVPVTVAVQGTGTATEVVVIVGETATQEPNVQLPFTRTIRVREGTPVAVTAQNGTDTGQLTAKVTGGSTPGTDTASGEFATVQAGKTSGEDSSTKTKSGGGTTGDSVSVSPSPLPSNGEVIN